MSNLFKTLTLFLEVISKYFDIKSKTLEYELDAKVESDIADLRAKLASLRESKSLEDKHKADEITELLELRIKGRNKK